MNHRLEVDRQLSEIRKARLKPYKLMEILSFYLIPKMMHSLTLSQVHLNTLKRLDTMIRQAVRAWLRLPNNTPTSYFHTAVLKGGIGVPCLSSTVPFLKRSRFEKLLVSQVPILRNVVTDSPFGPMLRNMNIPVRVQGITDTIQEETQGAWCEHLYNSNDGRGLQEATGSPLSSRWLLAPASVFPRIYIRGIHLRFSLLRTKVRNLRGGRGDLTVLCRGNCGQPESLSRILQSCWITHDARCAQHNRVAKELAKRLRSIGYTVFEELRVPTANSFIKPDLIAVKNGVATVMDVSIVGDGRAATAWLDKNEKLGAERPLAAIRLALLHVGSPVDRIFNQPIILSYRGICYTKSVKALILHGPTRKVISDLCLLTIKGSLSTYDVLMRGTWRRFIPREHG